MDYSRFTGDGTEAWLNDKYYYVFNGTDDLPTPEDSVAHNEYELVGLYMRVYNSYYLISNALVTQRLTQYEQLFKEWLAVAIDYLPDWFNSDRLDYKNMGE